MANRDVANRDVLTLDELIAKAIKAREESKLGGGTVVCLCEQQREYIEFTDAKLDQDEDGAVFILLLAKWG